MTLCDRMEDNESASNSVGGEVATLDVTVAELTPQHWTKSTTNFSSPSNFSHNNPSNCQAEKSPTESRSVAIEQGGCNGSIDANGFLDITLHGNDDEKIDSNGSNNNSQLVSAHTERISSGSKSRNSSTSSISPIKLNQKPTSSLRKLRFWRSKDSEPASTTALILEHRPSNLPKKSAEESEKHRLEYEKMIQRARRNEIKDAQKRNRTAKELRKHEETVASASTKWTRDILPNWETMRNTANTRTMWWDGLPPSVRGKVWQLSIGNDLNITEELYGILVARSHEKLRSMHETQSSCSEDTVSLSADRENSVDLIRLDISRTFHNLCIFQEGGPYHEVLHDILGAYVCYRPDVGYVQGMSFVAAMLLLNMEPAKAFISFANLLNQPCQLAFFRLNEEMMKIYFAAFEVFFEENLPQLFARFKQHNLTPDMYLIDWVFTMFSKALSLDVASRVWDMYCRDGEEFLFKTAIGILRLHEPLLLTMEFIHAAQLLTRLPTFTHHKLFVHINNVTMVSHGNRRWKDVLALLSRDDV